MTLEEILNQQPNKVSTDITSYNFCLYSKPGKGKTTAAINMAPQGRSFILAGEYGFKGIPGAMGAAVPDYFSLTQTINHLCDPRCREKFDTIIIDTTEKINLIIQEYILSQYGKLTIGDCKSRGGAYPLINRYYDLAFNKLKAMGYNFIYICHATETEVKNEKEEVLYTVFSPKMSDRLNTLIIPEVDYVFFLTDDKDGNRVLVTNETTRNYAKSRTKLPLTIPINKFEANKFKEEFVNGIKEEAGQYITSEKTKTTVVEFKEKEDPSEFNDLITKIKTIGNELLTQGKVEAMNITNNALGKDDDGNQRTLAQLDSSNTQMLKKLYDDLQKLK